MVIYLNLLHRNVLSWFFHFATKIMNKVKDIYIFASDKQINHQDVAELCSL